MVDVTPTPTAFKVDISCGHPKLTTWIPQVGEDITCWALCNPDTPTVVKVLNVSVYEPEEGVALVVTQGLSDEERAHVHRQVAETNRQLAGS